MASGKRILHLHVLLHIMWAFSTIARFDGSSSSISTTKIPTALHTSVMTWLHNRGRHVHVLF